MGSMSELGENLRKARKAAKLTQPQLAKLAGSSTTTISDIERGRNESSKDLFKIARVLNVSVEWLVEGNGLEHQDTDVATEFAWLYRNTTDEGRSFLRNAIDACKRAYMRRGVGTLFDVKNTK